MTGTLALVGAVVGAVLALTGAGGGVLAVPLLVFATGLSVQQAAPLALLAVGVAAGTGAWLGWREGVLRYRAAALVGGLGLLTAPLGVWLAQRLPPEPLLLGFAGVMLLTARRMARRDPVRDSSEGLDGRPCRLNPDEGRLHWTAPCAWVLATTGVAVGLVGGLLGVGGGFVIVPALTRATDLDTRSITTTSLGAVALSAVGGLAGALQFGQLDGLQAGVFSGSAIVALLLGRRVAGQLPSRTLRRLFAAVCVVVALLLLARVLLR